LAGARVAAARLQGVRRGQRAPLRRLAAVRFEDPIELAIGFQGALLKPD
jgi:hypothetical protein